MEEKNEQNVGATAFDLANNQNPRPHFKAYYGNQHVPHPTNEKAKNVPRETIMRQVNEGK